MEDVIDLMGLLAVWGVVVVVWIAMGMFEKRQQTKQFLQAQNAERERGHGRTESPDAGVERRIA
jgi:hypothetical protein